MSGETGQEGINCDMVCSPPPPSPYPPPSPPPPPPPPSPPYFAVRVMSCIIPCRPDDDEDDQLQAAVGCAKISQFFGSKPQNKTHSRHRFFQDRGLKPVTNL